MDKNESDMSPNTLNTIRIRNMNFVLTSSLFKESNQKETNGITITVKYWYVCYLEYFFTNNKFIAKNLTNRNMVAKPLK